MFEDTFSIDATDMMTDGLVHRNSEETLSYGKVNTQKSRLKKQWQKYVYLNFFLELPSISLQIQTNESQHEKINLLTFVPNKETLPPWLLKMLLVKILISLSASAG